MDGHQGDHLGKQVAASTFHRDDDMWDHISRSHCCRRLNFSTFLQRGASFHRRMRLPIGIRAITDVLSPSGVFLLSRAPRPRRAPSGQRAVRDLTRTPDPHRRPAGPQADLADTAGLSQAAALRDLRARTEHHQL